MAKLSQRTPRKSLTFTAPARRTYVVKKLYLASLKSSISSDWHVPKFMVSVFMLVLSLAHAVIYLIKVVFEQMIVVGLIVYFYSINFAWIGLIIAVAYVVYHGVFYLNDFIYRADA